MNLRRLVILFVTLLVTLTSLPINISAAQLTSASVLLSDSRPSAASVSYTFTTSNVTTGSAVMCFTAKFTPNADGTGSTLPTAMNITSAGVNTGNSNYIPSHTGFAVTVANNVITYKHATTGQTPANASGRTLQFTGITNGSTVETAYYAVFSTFTNTTCTTPIDSVTVAFIFVNGQVVTANVDPSLTFTIDPKNSGSVNGATINATSTTDGTIPFGTVVYNTPKIAAHTATVATNAAGGYSVTVAYTGVLASPGHNWLDHTGSNGTPTIWSATTEAFGYTTSSTSLSGTAARFSSNKWAAFSTVTPGEVGYKAAPTTSAETFDIGYQVSTGAGTPAGSYTTTIVITATPLY